MSLLLFQFALAPFLRSSSVKELDFFSFHVEGSVSLGCSKDLMFFGEEVSGSVLFWEGVGSDPGTV